MSTYSYAEILLPVPPDQTFTYYIPENMQGDISVGSRVVVNFGKRKLYTGIVVSLHNQKPDFDAKPIEDLHDDVSFVTSKQLELWEWISEYYCCSKGDVLNAAIPSALIPSSQSSFYFNENYDFEDSLNDSEIKIIK